MHDDSCITHFSRSLFHASATACSISEIGALLMIVYLLSDSRFQHSNCDGCDGCDGCGCGGCDGCDGGGDGCAIVSNPKLFD